MTASFDTVFPMKRPSRWNNLLFAEESDRDLDFDEGFEEDDLHQSKPPSRRPLLWILLLVLVGGIAYWTLNDPSTQMPKPAVLDSVEGINLTPQSNFPSPIFGEGQTVILTQQTGKSMLMGDPTNSQPGPIVQAGERMTILDGSPQNQGWVYMVRTESGKTGWVSGDKLKNQS